MLMSVIFERDEAKGLKDAARAAAQGIQHFGHAVDVARVGLKCNLDEIALGDCDRQLQQSSGCGNDLKPALGADSVA